MLASVQPFQLPIYRNAKTVYGRGFVGKEEKRQLFALIDNLDDQLVYRSGTPSLTDGIRTHHVQLPPPQHQRAGPACPACQPKPPSFRTDARL